MTKVTRYILIALLTAALIPYLVVCFYAFPFADDFCFGWTASESIPFVQKFLNQYLLWNGRYTADVLVNLHPLVSGKIVYYQLSCLVAIVAMTVAIYLLTTSLIADKAIQDLSIQKTHVGNDKTLKIYAVISALLITLFYLAYQPNITEGIYWYIGLANYHWGNLTAALQVITLISALQSEGYKRVLLHIASLLLLLLAVGFNEVGALIIPACYFTYLLLYKKEPKINRLQIAVYCMVAILASAFVFFSPGNFVRSVEFENRYNLLHSLLYAALQTIRFLAEWMLNVPFILLSAVVIANASKLKTNVQADYRLLLVALLSIVFCGSFLPYFATGVLGQHRTINYVFFFFILLWPLFLLSVSERFNLPDKLQPLSKAKVIASLLITSTLLLAITGNGVKLLADFKHHTFDRYEATFYKRQADIVQNPDKPIKILETIPATFIVVDVHSDTAWWVDKCMKKYYKDTGKVVY